MSQEATPPPAPRRVAYCSWHRGLSDTAVLVRIHEQATTFGGSLLACAPCREQHSLTPLGDQT